MKSIYDMMGKCTYPAMREEAPHEHVESFFQVSGGPTAPQPPPPESLGGSGWGQGAVPLPPGPDTPFACRRWTGTRTGW